MEGEREITLKQIEDALEQVWRECPLKEELLTDNLIHVYANGESWDLIMNKDAYEAEMDFAIRKDIELHNQMVEFFDEISRKDK